MEITFIAVLIPNGNTNAASESREMRLTKRP